MLIVVKCFFKIIYSYSCRLAVGYKAAHILGFMNLNLGPTELFFYQQDLKLLHQFRHAKRSQIVKLTSCPCIFIYSVHHQYFLISFAHGLLVCSSTCCRKYREIKFFKHSINVHIPLFRWNFVFFKIEPSLWDFSVNCSSLDQPTR